MISRILVIRLRAIGDVVLSTAVLPNLREAYPNAVIHFMTEPPSVPVIEGHPAIDGVLAVPGDPWIRPFRKAAWLEFFRFASALRKAKYDLVLDLFGNPRSAWITLFSGARVRVGFGFRGRMVAYNRVVEPRGNSVHEVEVNLDALRKIGVPVVSAVPMLPFGAGERSTVDAWIRHNRLDQNRLVALHVWGGWPAKRWGLNRFAGLADQLVSRHRAQVVLLWGPGERKHAEAVQSGMREASVLAPKLSLKELGALLSRCRLVVANDSGPMHIAAAVGAPTLGIFGPTHWRLQGPYGERSAVAYKKGLACLGCNKLECSHRTCMESLSVDEVLRVAEEALDFGSSARKPKGVHG